MFRPLGIGTQRANWGSWNKEFMQFGARRIVKSLGIMFLLAGAGFLSAADQNTNIPDELLQYVRSAREAGLSKTQIVKTMLDRGWSESLAESAVASVA